MKKGRVQIGRSNDMSIHCIRSLSRTNYTQISPNPKSRASHKSIDQNNFKYDIYNPGPHAEPFLHKAQEASPKKTLKRESSEETLDIPLNADRFKVLAIRRALRDKFAGTKDLQNLYSSWDSESIGVVRAQDIQKVLQSIGMVCDTKDITALISAVSSNKIGALTYPDFCKLMEIKQETHDLDSYLKANLIELTNKQSLDYSYRIRKIQNLLKYYLNVNQEKLEELMESFDRSRTGRVTFPQFVQIMNLLGIPYHTVNGLNLKILFFDFGGDVYGLDYKKFLEHIEVCKPFELEEDEEEIGVPADPAVLTQSKFSDLGDLPSRVKRMLKLSLRTKDNLLKELLERFGVKIRQNELRYYVQTKGRMSKDEIDSFLDVFVYDRKEQASVASIVEWVFYKESTDRAVKEIVLPKIERSQMTASQKFVNLLENIKSKVTLTEFDTDQDRYISRNDVREGLEKNNILFEEGEIRKLFEGLVGEPVLLRDFEIEFGKKVEKFCCKKRYLKPTKNGRSRK